MISIYLKKEILEKYRGQIESALDNLSDFNCNFANTEWELIPSDEEWEISVDYEKGFEEQAQLAFNRIGVLLDEVRHD